MKKTFKSLLFSLICSNIAFANDYLLEKTIFNGSSMNFIKHVGPGSMDNYLALNLPFEPMAGLFQQVLMREGKQLSNRGEAHITAVTPLEYWNHLKPRGITMQEINSLAEERGIQDSQFAVICLGQGEAVVDGKTEHTFFVVVHSENLLDIRKRIQNLVISRGGSASDFNPMKFYPHITLGFTKHDLHESDGVIKDFHSCVAPIFLAP